MSSNTVSTGDAVANQPLQTNQVQDEIAPVVIDSNSIVLLENSGAQTQPVRGSVDSRGGIQSRIDYDALASGLNDSANVHVSRASSCEVSDADSMLKSVDKETSLVGTVRPKVDLKHGYTNKFIKDLRINILVAGAQGLGKSTLLRALVFGICKYYNKDQQWEIFLEKNKKVKKTNKTGEIARLEFPWDLETDRKLIVTVIDSIGFGDTMDENKSFLPIQNFIVQKFSEWRKIKASGEYDEKEALRDPRVHCCLYFLQPSRVRQCDKINMSKLENYVPIVPIIAKTDSLTIPELNAYIFRDYYSEKKISNLTKYGHDMDDVAEGGGKHSGSETSSKVMDDEHESQDHGVLKSLQATNINYFRLDPRMMRRNTGGSSEIGAPKYSLVCGQHGYKACVDDVYAIVARDEFDEHGVLEARPYPWGNCHINDRYHSDFERLENMLFKGDNYGMTRLAEETEKRYRIWKAKIKKKEFNYRNVPFYTVLTLLILGAIAVACYMKGYSETSSFFKIAQSASISEISTNSSRPNILGNNSNKTHLFQSLGDCQAKYKQMNATLNDQILKIGLRMEKLKRCELYFNDMFEQQATEEVLADNSCNDGVNYYDKMSNTKTQQGSSVFEFIQGFREEHSLQNYYAQVKSVVNDWKNFVGNAGKA